MSSDTQGLFGNNPRQNIYRDLPLLDIKPLLQVIKGQKTKEEGTTEHDQHQEVENTNSFNPFGLPQSQPFLQNYGNQLFGDNLEINYQLPSYPQQQPTQNLLLDLFGGQNLQQSNSNSNIDLFIPQYSNQQQQQQLQQQQQQQFQQLEQSQQLNELEQRIQQQLQYHFDL